MESYFENPKHFANYCRKIAISYGVPREEFDEKFYQTFKDVFELQSFYHDIFRQSGVNDIMKIVQKNVKELKYNAFDWRLSFYDEFDTIKQLVKESKILISRFLDQDNNLDRELLAETCKNKSNFRDLPSIYTIIQMNDPFFYAHGNKITSNKFKHFMESVYEQAGIYLLYDSNLNISYIGQSMQLGKRITNHLPKPEYEFVSVGITKSAVDRFIYEPYYIIKYLPKNNSQYYEVGEFSFELEELNITEPLQIYE